VDDDQPSLAALLRAAAARDRSAGRASAAAAAAAPRHRARVPAGRPLPATAAGPLLRADADVGGARALRPPPPRHAARLGSAGGDAVREPLRRIFDVTVAATVLALTSPLLLIAMLAIRLETPGSPIYRQRRVGKDGVPFDV